MAIIFRTLLLLCLVLPVAAQDNRAFTVEAVPDPKSTGTGYVSDPDQVLTPAERSQLNQIISSIEDSTSAQIAVVVLNSIGAAEPKDFATRLFNHWGIGRAQNDNGLLILSVMDQRRTEFETGYGMEAVLPDAYCYRIGMQELVPYFKEGQYGMGLIKAVTRIGEILQNPSSAPDIWAASDGQPGDTPSKRGDPLFFLLGLIVFVNLLFLGLLALRVLWVLRNKEDLYDKYCAIRPLHSLFYLFIAPLVYLPIYLFLSRLLDKLRNQPRYSRVNGKPMRKLSEQEEDRFLERGQLTEEEIGSVDYDVWITDDEDDTLVLRYARRFSKYKTCPECSYRTFYLAQTVVLSRATYTSTGLRRITYLCKNCGFQKEDHQVIPQLTRSSGGSSGSRSSSSGGGSWGGGRSGGGGSGVSW